MIQGDSLLSVGRVGPSVRPSFLLVCLFVTERKTLRLPRSEDLGRLVLCGSIGISGTHLLFIYGLRATTA